MTLASMNGASRFHAGNHQERFCADACSAPSRAECDFYEQHDWCLNPFPTIDEAVTHLGTQLAALRESSDVNPPPWQLTERMTNVFLLSCGIISTMEDYLHGQSYRLPWRLGMIPLSARFLRAFERTARWWLRRRCRSASLWKESWQKPFAEFTALLLEEAVDRETVARLAQKLETLMPSNMPRKLAEQRLNLPSAFRRQDLSHHDVRFLGEQFVARYPDRQQALLIVGPRTSGSFLAPLLQAFLRRAGYVAVEFVTVRPKLGPSAAERLCLKNGAAQGSRALLIDDSPSSGWTVVTAVHLLRDMGFAAENILALLPIHPRATNWQKEPSAVSVLDVSVISLPQSDWYKSRQLERARAEVLVGDYFRAQGYRTARIMPDARCDAINAHFDRAVATARGTRLKRVYAFALEDEEGNPSTRHVLAKSVGWGWLGYHAFVAGHRLAQFVPPLLGLRDGILYSEWLMSAETNAPGDRSEWVDTAADYVAERTRSMPLARDLSAHLVRTERHLGADMLASAFLGAFGRKRVGALYSSLVLARLAALPCPAPTLIDGRMGLAEWLRVDGAYLKTDYEHHGLGKAEVNAVDPAFDLSQFLLALDASASEEARLVSRYIAKSGDAQVSERLFVNKLMTGIASREAALEGLEKSHHAPEQNDLHRRFVEAWNFLTLQCVHHCGQHCHKPAQPTWHAPLVVLDIDGVLDRRLFGFPTTTAAGIEALSLLHSHGFAVAMNSARSSLEVRAYCRGYGFAGGLAEYGSWAWDAVTGRERVLVTDESARQMERLREALARVPGIFVNDTYRHSIRANAYEAGEPVPIPKLTIKQLLADLGLDRLRFTQTMIDTTVLAAEVDKGTGLNALLEWVGLKNADATAVGDSAPDLPMFRVAGRSFAPGHIGCAREARMLGCRIAEKPFQPGLLSIVRELVHPDGTTCARCRASKSCLPADDLFFDLLRRADKPIWSLLLRGLLDPKALRIFLKAT